MTVQSSGITFRGVRTSELTGNPANVRQHLDDVDELAASMLANGVLQPLIVNDQAGTLIVTDGHRRLAAAQRAHIPVVPCLITTDVDQRQVVTTMLAAAMHKELKPLEQARAFDSLRREGMNTAAIAKSTGYSVALIRSRLGLLDLPTAVGQMVDAGEMTLGAAKQLADQVKATRTGSAYSNDSKGTWLRGTHRLAGVVEEMCAGASHLQTRRAVGGVGCGQCWEAAIRADERRLLAEQSIDLHHL